jgi:ATP-dependent DNA helicase RecQ
LRINNDVLQKAIYRLSLLGIVSDWTTNFIDHFEVQFKTQNETTITKSVSNYITKYEPNTDVETEIIKKLSKNGFRKISLVFTELDF